MSVETLYPVSDAVSSDWDVYPSTPITHYDKVDDGATHDGDSTYIYEATIGLEDEQNALFNPGSHSIPVGATINHVTVAIYAKRTSTSGPSIRIKVRLSGTDAQSANIAPSAVEYTEYTEQFDEKPGGGSWVRSNIDNTDFGVWLVGSGKSGEVRVTSVEMRVDWTAAVTITAHAVCGICVVKETVLPAVIPFEHDGTLYAPIDIETDRLTNPTTASDDPLFTGVVKFQDEVRTAEYVQIQIGSARYASDIWSSDWIAITSTAHGVRTPEVSYAGSTVLGSGRTYYVRMRLKDDLVAIGAWSDELATFSGVISAWWDQSFAFRERVGFAAVHDGFAAADMLTMNMETGLREVVASDGFFDEGLSYDSHSIVYYQGKTHIAYLGMIDKTGANPTMPIMVVTKDHLTGLWGTPTNVGSSGTSFDTHYYAAITVTPADGKLQLFYGCHNTAMKYRRSVNSNDSTSWTSEASLGGQMTYPHAFVLPNNDMFVIARGTYGLDNTKISLNHSTDGGSTWGGWKTIAINNLEDAHRTYCPGVRVDYDATPIRLHVALYFVILPTGYETGWSEMCVYAYSDYDSGETHRFYQWYTHNDEPAGNTDTSNPIKYYTIDPIRKTDIIYEASAGQRDEVAILFCYLDSNRSPQIVMNTAPFGGNRWHTTLGMAKISGTGWAITWFTKDLDIDVWHARQGGCAMMDINKIIRVYHIVCPKRYSINLPTSNGTHTDFTKSNGGIDYFEHVDDDRILLDESEYLYSTTQGHQCSFGFSFSLPAHAVVLAVDVSYFAVKSGTGSPEVRPILRINTTDYVASSGSTLDIDYFSSGWPVSGHGEYHFTWWQNPATTLDWQTSDLTGLQAGLKYHADPGASPQIRLARLQCRVLIMEGGHTKWFAGELVEFSSPDNGVTWSYRFLTGNSSHGLPIVSMKERLTNKQIELMYVQGNDVMYYAPKSWGFMRKDGRDLRLIYNGTEINRLALDHFNLTSSVIAFQSQDAVASNAPYPVKNLYAYSGNGSAGPAKMDPSNVFSVLYEGFETYEDGDDIDGLGGWTVITGTATVYQASKWIASLQYNHNNKTYAGLQALYLPGPGSSSTVERTLGADLVNIIIEVSCWVDTSGGTRAYLEIEDGSSNIFRVGLYNAGEKGQYYDTSWHDTSVVGDAFNHYRLKLLITSNGVTAWFRDELVETDNNVLNSVDKLRLKTEGSGAYFDHLQIYNYIATQGTIGTDAREYHGEFSDATIIGMGQRQNLSDAQIDGYKTHIRSSMPFATRQLTDKSDILHLEHKQVTAVSALEAVSVGASMSEAVFLSHGATKLISSVAELPYSILSRTDIPQLLHYELNQIMESQAVCNFGLLQRLGTQAILPAGVGVGTALVAMMPFSYRGLMALASVSPFSTRLQISLVGMADFETLQRILIVANEEYEVQAETALPAVLPFDVASDTAMASSLSFDLLRRISTPTITQYGSLKSVPLAIVVPFSHSGTMGLQAVLNYQLVLEDRAQAILPYSYIRVRALQAMLAIAHKASTSTAAVLPLSTTGKRGIVAHTSYETLAHAHAQAVVRYGQLQRQAIQALVPFSHTGFMSLASTLYFGNRSATSTQAVLEFETLLASLLYSYTLIEVLRQLMLATILPFDVLQTGIIEAGSILNFEVGKQMRAAAFLGCENLITSRIQATTPFDLLIAMSQALNVPFDLLEANSVVTTVLPYEISLQSTTTAMLPYENLQREQIFSLLELEQSLAIKIEMILPFGVAGATSAVAGVLPLDVLRNIGTPAILGASMKAATSASADLPFSLSSKITAAAAHLPIEQLQRMELVANTMHSVMASAGIAVTIQIDVQTDTAIGAVLNLEYMKRASIVQVQVSFETLTRLALQTNLPVEVIGYIFGGFLITDFEITGHSVKLESTQGFKMTDWSSAGLDEYSLNLAASHKFKLADFSCAGYTITVISVTPGMSDKPEASWPLENLR